VLKNTVNRKPVFGLIRNGAILGMVLILGACAGPGFNFGDASDKSFINNESKFSVAAFGVAASPRVTTARNVPRGGGRAVVGKPYRVAGKWYYPKVETNYDKMGTASWYGPNFQGRLTANGEIFDQNFLSAAHPTLPLPSYVRVKNLSNGRTVTVRVNDRGPFANNRLIDLSRRSAEVLGFINQGTARVRVTYIGRAPVEGDDTRYLVASINSAGGVIPDSSATQGTRQPSVISRQNGGIFGAVISLFSYAGPQTGDLLVADAHAAVNAIADNVVDLAAWQSSVQESEFARVEPRNVSIDLGTYSDREFAAEVARQFAFLGAVDATFTGAGNDSPIHLKITTLKPGVSESDVAQFALELGLDIS